LIAVVVPQTGFASTITTFTFDAITLNNEVDVAIGESQIFLDVVDLGGTEVELLLRNTGPDNASITDVYIEDSLGLLGDLTSITSSDGVDFSLGASPGNLPGGEDYSFTATETLTTSSNPPTQPSGVNPDEWLSLVFTVSDGITYDDLIAALLTADLRIGVHVQGFDSEGSESFINSPSPVPLPPAAWAFLPVLAGLLTFAHRSARRTV
jgi:hypothetical protein